MKTFAIIQLINNNSFDEIIDFLQNVNIIIDNGCQQYLYFIFYAKL